MGKARVLLSGDEGTGTLAAVRGLHAAGYEVWLAVYRSDTYAARSRRCAGVLPVTNPSDMEAHTRDLAAAAARVRAAAVLPGTEGSLRAVTGRERLFPEGVRVGTCAPEVLDRATDKLLLGQLARDAGLDAPPSFDLSEELVPDELPLPAIVKPQRSVTDQGRALRWAWSVRVSSREQLRGLLEGSNGDHRLLQPYISGTLAAVCGVAWGGELVCAVHQASRRIWPPEQGISSYAVTVPANPSRQAGVAALVRAISWSGVFGVQFLIDERGSYVIDFNPRIYGSMGLAIAAGLNLPAIWADLLLDRPVEPCDYRPGVHYRSEEDDYRALARQFRHGDRGEALQGLLPRRRTVHAVFALSDPKPLLTSLEKLRQGD